MLKGVKSRSGWRVTFFIVAWRPSPSRRRTHTASPRTHSSSCGDDTMQCSFLRTVCYLGVAESTTNQLSGTKKWRRPPPSSHYDG